MSNNINVSLDTSVTPNVLDVDDHGGTTIHKNPKPQTITWHLTGQIAQGNFVPMSDPEPGFEWVSDPLPARNVFGDAAPGTNGNSMSITDTHASSSSDGSWTYKLRVLYNGTVYCTTSGAGIGNNVKDPIIINR